jgi:6-pyruvoyltetrahydropterin/6-carboxytetrahydropterin synthase
MKLELRQHFQIESARFLPNLPTHHPCRRMHGHSFKITLTLVGETDPQIGWVIDYGEIEKLIRPLLNELDHRVLNEVPGLENPTSENLCVWLFERARKSLPILSRVTVAETLSTECSFPA